VNSPVVDKIRSRAYWDVAIRPATFVANRVPYAQLDEIIASVEVRLRGWPVPCVDARREFRRGEDWVGQDIDAHVVSMYEAWRFFMSGQFAHLRAVSVDWRSGAETTSMPGGFIHVIEVWEILFYLTEVFELAARLALGPSGDDRMIISANLVGLKDRGLVVGQRNRLEFFEPYKSDVGAIFQEVELTRARLVAEAHLAAAEMAREFFARFGWKPSLQQLLDHQRDLTERR
jgi:hypothetical protein